MSNTSYRAIALLFGLTACAGQPELPPPASTTIFESSGKLGDPMPEAGPIVAQSQPEAAAPQPIEAAAPEAAPTADAPDASPDVSEPDSSPEASTPDVQVDAPPPCSPEGFIVDDAATGEHQLMFSVTGIDGTSLNLNTSSHFSFSTNGSAPEVVTYASSDGQNDPLPAGARSLAYHCGDTYSMTYLNDQGSVCTYSPQSISGTIEANVTILAFTVVCP
jgi:hypothetical protein